MQLDHDMLSRGLQVAVRRNTGNQVENSSFPSSFDKIFRRLPLEERKSNSEGVLPMLEEDWFQELVVVGELQFDFRQVLLKVELDDALEHILLILRTELTILENLCKHNYNS